MTTFKRLFNFIKKRKLGIDVVLVSLLISLSYYAWRLLPGQFIRGGSLVYLTTYVQNWWLNRPNTFMGFQTAVILTSILSVNLFGANINLYWWTALIVMFITYAIFYIFVRIISKNRLVAFSATLIFAVNYFANFNMVVDCYCHLGERMIVVPLLLLSLIFLHLFLEKIKKNFFISSLIFYFFGIGLAHFSLLFTAPYVLYPIFWHFFNRKKTKDIIKGILIGISYLAISVFFVFMQNIVEPGVSGVAPFLQFLLHPQEYRYPEYMLRQLVYWSQYPILIKALLAGQKELQNVPSVLNAIRITPYVAFVYAFASFFIYIKLPKQRAMFFTIIFAIAIIFYLNSWFGQYVIVQQVGSNRYLYYPTFLLAIFWSYFLWAAFLRRKIFYIIAFLILAIYFYINTILIRDAFFAMMWANDRPKALVDHFIHMRKNLKKNTLVVAQSPEVGYYEATFYTERLGKGEVRLASENDNYDDWRSVASTSAHIIRLSYDSKCECVREEKIK